MTRGSIPDCRIVEDKGKWWSRWFFVALSSIILVNFLINCATCTRWIIIIIIIIIISCDLERLWGSLLQTIPFHDLSSILSKFIILVIFFTIFAESKEKKKMTNQNFLWNNNFSSLVTLLLRLFSSGLKRWPRVTVQLKKQQSTKIRKINRNKNKKNNSARTISSKRIYIYTKWERS